MSLRFVDTYGYDTKLVVPEQPWAIYGNPTNFNYFVKTPLVPASAAARQYQTSTRSAHTRRRYAGDPSPSNVSAHSYSYIDDPGRKVGNAVPGWSFILDDGLEKRQFTTTGDVILLIAYLEDEVNNETKLYTQGARYTLAAAAAPGG